MPWGQLPSASLASSRRLETEPSKTRSSTRAITPPITVGSMTTLASMVRPVALDSAFSRRSPCLSVNGTADRISATACSRLLAASCTTASAIFDRSRARPDSITNEIRVTVVLFARGPRMSRTSAWRLSTGSASSVSASRSAGFCSAAFAKANSSSSTLARSPSASATATSAVAYAAALSPLPKMRSSSSIALLGPLLVRALLAGSDLRDVVVDQLLVRLLVERLPHDPARELDGDLADLGPQLVEDPVALRPDLVLGAGDRVLGLLLGVGLDVAPELVRRHPGLLDDPVALVAGVRELRPIVRELLLGLLARLLGALELSLDLLTPFLEQRVDPGQHPLPEEEEQDEERDRGGDELRRLGVEVGLLAGRSGFLREDRKADDEHERSSLDDERERDAEQRERLDQPDPDEHGRADLTGVLGLASHRLDRLADQDPKADAGADGGEPDHEPLADGLQTGSDINGLRDEMQHPVPP